MTPMMEQYFEIKNKYKDHILFYRLGDFYEMFFDDAIVASRELELTLTGRDCGEEERAPMCGVPFHSSEGYIGTLVAKGYKVAICEQTEDPALAKGLVRREVIRVVTPGTLIESNLLPEKRNNFLCSMYINEFECGIAFADISTAQVYATFFCGDEIETKLRNELGTYAPSEVITNLGEKKLGELADFVRTTLHSMLNDNRATEFQFEDSQKRVKNQFGESVKEDYLENRALVSALGGLLSYIEETQKKDISYIKELNVYLEGQYLEMDINTRRNLELTQTMRTKEKKGSLLGVLDRTVSAAGARLLCQWVEHPLLNVNAIIRRQNAIEELADNYIMREEMRELLSHVLDIERLVTRIVYGTANARDLRAVASTVAILPELKSMLESFKCDELAELAKNLETLEDVFVKIDTAICENPPVSIREGGMIAEGFNGDVDYLRSVMKDGKSWISRIADEEKARTGIKTLKIGYNKVFGYYIEVSKSFVNMVPDSYIRKQTLANGERYITDELKDMEATILGASDKVNTLEYDIFCEVRGYVADNSTRLQKVASLLAKLDAYQSLATVAVKNKYIRPEVDKSDVVYIKDGRHPVVEHFVKDSYFVPNDANLDTGRNRLMLITGPNMAGKSTYMRQVAIIVLMAQMGSFVPANDARIGVVDKLFTRVGASDDLASGQSTFMLEMNEVAYILRNATKQSLIIYDEVGRGTSTFDGMSIARAIVEYTSSRKIGAKTLFATHYHELTVMEDEIEGVVNYNIAAKKRGDNITFLRKIVKGSTDDSYGIEVAKLAGLPGEVIRRAKEILAIVEQSAQSLTLSGDENTLLDEGLITVEEHLEEQIIQELRAVDVNAISPLEALQLLYDLKKRLMD